MGEITNRFGIWPVFIYKAMKFTDKLVICRGSRYQRVIVARQCYKSRVGDQRGQASAFFQWHPFVAFAMHDQYRNAQLARHLCHIDIGIHIIEARGVLRRRGNPLQFVKPSLLRGAGVGNKIFREHMPIGWIRVAPASTE